MLSAAGCSWKELLDAQEAEMRRVREKAAASNDELQRQNESLKDALATANRLADEQLTRADRAERALEKSSADAERARHAAAELAAADLRAQQDREAELQQRQEARERQLREQEQQRLVRS